MAIVAQFQEAESPAGSPRQPRRTLRLEAQGALESGGATRVLVHNISTTGLLIESPLRLAGGERLAIELPEAGPCRASVVWSSGNLYGCQFEAAIPSSVLSAAQLRSAVSPVEFDEGRATPATPDVSFGLRLQQLRAARGLSQGQVATALGVSKPTVWAWEHNKARPVEDRLDALAETLGVERAELIPRRRSFSLDEMIAGHREQIAAALGTSADKVRIWVEL